MPVVVGVHHLKNFDEWIKLFKADRPPKVGRWRLLRGSDDRNRVHVVGYTNGTPDRRIRLGPPCLPHAASRCLGRSRK
jgi:hypothetical protein